MKTHPEDPTPDPAPDPAPEDSTAEIVPAGDGAPHPQDVDELVKRTARIIRQGKQSSRKGLKEIFEGTLHLMDLQLRHSAQGARNDLFPDEKKSGFLRALEESDTPPATAYRWIKLVRPFLVERGITDSNFPVPDTHDWVKMVKTVKMRIEQLNGIGLPTRVIPIPKDEEILTRLRTAAAAGYTEAKQLLSELDAGITTMEEATRRYCQIEKPTSRPLPALLKLNPKTLEPEGRAVKALGVVEELFSGWKEFPEHVRLQARARIREVMGKLPADCQFHED